jgi:hypothetical protein
MIFIWFDYTPVSYGDYVLPPWANSIGWGISFISVSAIPITALIKLCFHHGACVQVTNRKSKAINRKYIRSACMTSLHPRMTGDLRWPFTELNNTRYKYQKRERRSKPTVLCYLSIFLNVLQILSLMDTLTISTRIWK